MTDHLRVYLYIDYRVCLSTSYTLTSSCCQLSIWKNSIEIFNLSCCFILAKKICILGNSSPQSVCRPCECHFILKVIKIIKMNPRRARCRVIFCEIFMFMFRFTCVEMMSSVPFKVQSLPYRIAHHHPFRNSAFDCSQRHRKCVTLLTAMRHGNIE